MRLSRALLFIALWLLPSLAVAQSGIQATGQRYTPGHTVRAMNPQGTALGDAGGAAGSSLPGQGYLTELGITNTGLPLCVNDALTNAAGGYHQLCIGANPLSNGQISLNSFGGATAVPLIFSINGSAYNFPGNGQGNILGPNSSCVGCLAYFNNNVGTLASSAPQLLLTQTGFPAPTHGFTIDVTATLSGTYGAGPTTANLLHTINTGAQSTNSNFTSTLLIEHEFGGSTVVGGQNALEIDAYFDKGATSPTNTNRNYVAGFFQMVAFNGDGGTDPTMAATSKGGIFGMNPFGDAKFGIAFANVTGGEVNVALETGTSAFEKTGLQIVDHGLDRVHGSYIDAGLAIGAQVGAVGFSNGILFSNGNGGTPLTTTACMICTTANTVTVATGIDFSQYFITGNFLNSRGFFVTGAGAISGVAQFLTGANPGPTFQPSQTSGGFISSNFTNGSNEVDFFNLVNNAAGFNFYQKTGASTGSLLLTVGSGTIVIPSMITTCSGAMTGSLWNSGGTVHVC